jgi:hypothetical protein
LPLQQLNPLMANNPLFDESAQPAAQPAAPPAAPPAEQPELRRSERIRESPKDVYGKFMYGLPRSSYVNFPLSGFPLSP